MSHQTLIQTIQAQASLPAEAALSLAALSTPRYLKKGDHFIRAGEVPKHFAFIQTGLFRYYYLDEQGNEFTKAFFTENAFLSSYSAMVLQRPSYFSIEALEDAHLHAIAFADWQTLRQQDGRWNELLLAILQKAFIKKEERERQFLLFDAEKRYRLFLQDNPGLDQRVNQRLIASYLGITPVALSRIRKKMGVLT